MAIFEGLATAMITPFKNGKVDFDALEKLIDFQLKNDVSALVMCGTTGEASTLSAQEKNAVISFAIEQVEGRIPVIAGTGANNTMQAIETSQMAEKAGADALLIVTPYYNKTTQRGLIAHYFAIADEVNLPIIVYNVPSRTGVNVLPETMEQLLTHPRIVGIKEASGNIEQIVTLAARCEECEIYAGNDDHVVPMMSMGAVGVISTVGNVIPGDVQDMCTAFSNGNIELARELQMKILPICKAAFCEVNPIPVKYMLSAMGMCTNELRLPLVLPAEENRERIEKALCEYGLI